MTLRHILTLSFIAAILASVQARADALTVTDDTGATVTLAVPAKRIVSLAPHVTELLFAAGGGTRIVGAVSYSDYPPQAKSIPRVGDNKALDLESIVAMKPDLIVVWRHGNAMRQIDRLRELHVPLFSASRTGWTISLSPSINSVSCSGHRLRRIGRRKRSVATFPACGRVIRTGRR